MIAIVAIGVGLFVGGTACFADGSDDEGEAQPGAGAAAQPLTRKAVAEAYPLLPHSLRQNLITQLDVHCAMRLRDSLSTAALDSVGNTRGLSEIVLRDRRDALEVPSIRTFLNLWTFLITAERTPSFQENEALTTRYPETYVPTLTREDVSADVAFTYLFQETADYIYHWAHPQGGEARKGLGQLSRENLARTVYDAMISLCLDKRFVKPEHFLVISHWPANYRAGGRH